MFSALTVVLVNAYIFGTLAQEEKHNVEDNRHESQADKNRPQIDRA